MKNDTGSTAAADKEKQVDIHGGMGKGGECEVPFKSSPLFGLPSRVRISVSLPR